MLDNYNYNRQQQMYRRNQGNNNYRTQRNMGCNECNDDSKCDSDKWALGMAYVPWQQWGNVYEPCKALNAGTIFPVLDLPFMGRSCGRR